MKGQNVLPFNQPNFDYFLANYNIYEQMMVAQHFSKKCFILLQLLKHSLSANYQGKKDEFTFFYLQCFQFLPDM